MDLNELNELDLNAIGEWPIPIKVVVILIASLAVAGAVYYFDTEEQLVRLERAATTERDLRASFESKQRKAANLDEYRQQVEEMTESFGAMLRQLPNRTEVASLLVDVSRTGLAAGLEFELFQPGNEQIKDFYAELPIQIRVTGTYPDFGRFVSGLAALSRIVTVHDIRITEGGGTRARGGDRLTLEASVKTYRYLDEDAS
ncbi:pilus assembly protein PilO [Thiocapsa imhoffii]|uniref:Pilus assembly protein PilO n=1 Tax=Thiocapsa imhoffii TaxID=382777 RepID=A0A9X0WI86_9GAMM|nr:type 4a pilus biogenesis protein PilO [Thiocapsa imhoffii]MBK1644980.1 pilus assembly protein PilO [Thiocapsa imhoffii]